MRSYSLWYHLHGPQRQSRRFQNVVSSLCRSVLEEVPHFCGVRQLRGSKPRKDPKLRFVTMAVSSGLVATHVTRDGRSARVRPTCIPRFYTRSVGLSITSGKAKRLYPTMGLRCLATSGCQIIQNVLRLNVFRVGCDADVPFFRNVLIDVILHQRHQRTLERHSLRLRY